MRLPRIGDLAEWLRQTSEGFVPFTDVRTWLDDPELLEILETFQFNGLLEDIRAHRSGGPPSRDLGRLLDLVATRHDMTGLIVYRGLAGVRDIVRAEQHTERSISSWSAYPSIALRSALVQSRQDVGLLRQRIRDGENTMALDDWEFEVLRPPLQAKVIAHRRDWITYAGVPVGVSVVDLECGHHVERPIEPSLRALSSTRPRSAGWTLGR